MESRMKPTSGSGSESKLYVICSQQILCAKMAVLQEKLHVLGCSQMEGWKNVAAVC